MNETNTFLSAKDLEVSYETSDAKVFAVNGVSFSLSAGKTLGLVGETGAGKTTIARSILRVLPVPPAKIKNGQVIFGGKDIFTLTEDEMCKIRGDKITMIFQDPMTSLNPIMTIGEQITEVVRMHNGGSKPDARKRAVEMLEMVGIPPERYNEFPHQFSGGMKQRVVIAIALVCNPDLLLADEPTTALDVTIQAQVLDLIRRLNKTKETAMILITHDLGVVAEMCDEVAIVYAGSIVEKGSLEDIFKRPSHPYTRGLFGAIPEIDSDRRRLIPIAGLPPDPTNLPSGCSFHPRCPEFMESCKTRKTEMIEIEKGHYCKCLKALDLLNKKWGDVPASFSVQINENNKYEQESKNQNFIQLTNLKKYFSTSKGTVHAVDGITMGIPKGKTMGVVGESGCGKTTLGRVLIHMDPVTEGRIFFDGRDITALRGEQLRKYRERAQFIFQDPYSSLNPRMTVEDCIIEVLHRSVKYHGTEINARLEKLMDMVGVARRFRASYPHELDGGRRQRVVIARALALDPEFIVCDEPVSALDVSIQAQILNLLQDLQEEHSLTYMFITHDMSVVRHISNYISVMYLGQLVETSPSKELFIKHYHPYTKALLSAIPSANINKKMNRILLKGEITSPIDPKPGCRFAQRCFYMKEECHKEQRLTELSPGHFVSCCLAHEINSDIIKSVKSG